MLFKYVTNIRIRVRIRGYLLTGIRICIHIRGSSCTGIRICIRIRGASRAGIHTRIRIRGYANFDIRSISNLDTNIVSKMSKFADDTELCHRARNPEDIMELEEDINKLVERAYKWQMSFNVDKCSVMHIGHNIMQSNYQQLPKTDQQWDLGIIITKDLKWQKQTEKSCKTANRVLRFIDRNFRYKNKELILPL